jgi:UDP-N-acetylmuramyl tripeptide synthase
MAARKSPRKTKQNKSILARTGRTMRDRPYTSAAIATGAVTAVAAAAAGAFFFRRSDKSLAQIADDVTDRIKSAADRAKARFEGDQSQREIAEEALTLKQTGKKNRKPADPLVEDQLKAGSVAY